jgi:hypothetical protein
VDQSPPVLGWLFEVVGPLIWLALAAFFASTCMKRRALTLPTLVFIGGTTMWWQEWYGDWGAYVLYNPHLALIPGYHWPLTSPNKPWGVIPAYGWFYALVYFPVLWACKEIHARFFPTAKLWVVVVAVSWPFFYVWDTLIEGGASILGPAMESTRGNFPLLYPVLTFSGMMTITLLVIGARTPQGTPLVESWTGVDRLTGTKRNVGRILTWVVTMNLCYLIFIVPTVLIRLAFLPPDSLVP